MKRLHNFFKGVWYQLRKKGWFRNFFITRNAWGLFHKNSHINQTTGKEKQGYPREESALKAAASMEKKHGKHFSVYKCIYCDGYHLGKNRDNKGD